MEYVRKARRVEGCEKGKKQTKGKVKKKKLGKDWKQSIIKRRRLRRMEKKRGTESSEEP